MVVGENWLCAICDTLLFGQSLGWLVGCFGLNGPIRQYFSPYRAVSQREGERGEKRQKRAKTSKQAPSAPSTHPSAVGPWLTVILFGQNVLCTHYPSALCACLWGVENAAPDQDLHCLLKKNRAQLFKASLA